MCQPGSGADLEPGTQGTRLVPGWTGSLGPWELVWILGPQEQAWCWTGWESGPQDSAQCRCRPGSWGHRAQPGPGLSESLRLLSLGWSWACPRTRCLRARLVTGGSRAAAAGAGIHNKVRCSPTPLPHGLCCPGLGKVVRNNTNHLFHLLLKHLF